MLRRILRAGLGSAEESAGVDSRSLPQVKEGNISAHMVDSSYPCIFQESKVPISVDTPKPRSDLMEPGVGTVLLLLRRP